MTSIQDEQSPVNALHNKTCMLFRQLLTLLGSSSPEGQAEQNTMSEFLGVVGRVKNQPQTRVFHYNLKTQYLNQRIAQLHPNEQSRVPPTIGGGIHDRGSGGGGRKGAAARPASSQNVQQPVQKPQKKIHSKTLRSLPCLNTPSHPPNLNASTRKQAC